MQKARFLVIRFSSIGDIVLTTPVLRYLQRVHGGSEVHYLTKKSFAPILQHNPHVHKLWTIEKSTHEVVEELRNQHFDYIIDLHRNLRSWRVKRALGTMSFTFNKLNARKWLLVNLGWNLMPDRHVVDRYLDTLSAFEISPDDDGLEYFLGEEDRVHPEALHPTLAAGRYLVFAIGAQHWRKKLPEGHIVRVCQNLGVPVALLGGPEDAEAGARIAALCPNAVNLCGKLRLNQSASVVQQCGGAIAHDTGLMHIAAAFKKPIVSVWGATVPEFGMYPYRPGEPSSRVAATHLTRRPCSKLGTRCKYKPCRCVEEIDPLEVVVAARQIVTPEANQTL